MSRESTNLRDVSTRLEPGEVINSHDFKHLVQSYLFVMMRVEVYVGQLAGTRQSGSAGEVVHPMSFDNVVFEDAI